MPMSKSQVGMVSGPPRRRSSLAHKERSPGTVSPRCLRRATQLSARCYPGTFLQSTLKAVQTAKLRFVQSQTSFPQEIQRN